MIGPHITRLRTARHWSISELARRTGISKGHISTIERDDAGSIGLDIVQTLARTFGISVSALIGEDRELLPYDLVEAQNSVRAAQTPQDYLAALIAQNDALNRLLTRSEGISEDDPPTGAIKWPNRDA